MNTVDNKQTNRPGTDQTLEHDLSPSAVIVKCISTSIYLSYSQKNIHIIFKFYNK